MMKAIAAILVSFLAAPSNVLAQTATVGASRIAIVHMASTPSSDGLRQSIARESAKLAQDPGTTSPQTQQPPQRTWAGRHPVALGAMIGVAGGVIWGTAVCRTACEGGLHTPLWQGFGAGVGAGIGAGIGAIVSAVRR